MNLNQKPKLTRRSLLCILFLFGAASLLILLTLPSGSMYGSQTDWYCQHVTLADYMRKHFYATGQLFPISLVLEEVPTFLPCPTMGCSGRMYFYLIFYLVYPLLPSSRDMQFLKFS